MLEIFSDAGLFEKHCFAATLILENYNRCQALFAKHYENLPTSTNGELLAVINGLEWVCQNRPEEREIELNIDNLSIATRIAEYPKNVSVPSGPMSHLWVHIFVLLDRFDNVTVYHIPAHQETHNPNKACDVLCAALLRPYKKGLMS